MFYSFVRVVLWIICRFTWRFTVTGLENIPKEGAFLLCGNHIHLFDAPGENSHNAS